MPQTTIGTHTICLGASSAQRCHHSPSPDMTDVTTHRGQAEISVQHFSIPLWIDWSWPKVEVCLLSDFSFYIIAFLVPTTLLAKGISTFIPHSFECSFLIDCSKLPSDFKELVLIFVRIR